MTPNPSDTWIVIAAYNEGQVIRSVVTPLVRAGYSVLVVDDCSTDHTRDSLLGSGVYYCRHVLNLGQGAALQTGFEYAVSRGARYVVTFDADGQHRANEIPRLIEALQREGCDIVLGSRFCDGGQALNISRGKARMLKLATLYTRLTSGLRVSDTHNGFRAMTAAAAKQLNLNQNRMAHASEILTRISQLNLRYFEVPVTIEYSDYSVSKGQKMRGMLMILWDSFFAGLRGPRA